MTLSRAPHQSVVKQLAKRLRQRNPKSGLQRSIHLASLRQWNVAASSTSTASIYEQTSPSWRQEHSYFQRLAAIATMCGIASVLGVNVSKCEKEVREFEREELQSENKGGTSQVMASPLMQAHVTKCEEEVREFECEGFLPGNGGPSQVMASLITQTLPAMKSISSSAPSHKPMFSVRRQQKLNGWAALEAKEDMKKIQMAQLLSELHKLAEELRPTTDKENLTTEGDNAINQAETDGAPETGLAFPAEGINKEISQNLIQQLRHGVTFTKESFIQLIRAGAEVVMQDATLLDLSEKQEVFVVGDLHGSIDNLHEVLNIVGDINDEKAVVFNGDFVDRGDGGVEVVSTLILLKLTYPNSVILIRGNHEDSLLTSMYGFEEEVRAKYGKKGLQDIWGSLSDFFAALPLACKTRHAAIMHGGIPCKDFKLDQIQEVSCTERSKIPSFIDEALMTPTAKVLRDMVWSDPSVENGLAVNENRGLGCHYGVDISRTFLDDHGLHYLIRSHEVMDEGWDVIECGDNKYVLTVFSTSAYPDGFGDNKGAVLLLDNETGMVEPKLFKIPPKTEGATVHDMSPLTKAVFEVILDNKKKLVGAFEKIQASDGTVTVDEWVHVMQSELDMHMDWPKLQVQIAPTKLEEVQDGEYLCSSKIDWNEFLNNTFSGHGISTDTDVMESLFTNHNMLLAVFRFLDTDGNGKLDKEEFVSGITLLNSRLPEERQFSNPESLFQSLDFDKSGEIDLDEFAAAFNIVSKPPDQSVLSKIFHSLDNDGSGTVDLGEFRAAIAKLNQKLPHDRQILDPDALFKNLDMNGDGELDIDEFSSFYF